MKFTESNYTRELTEQKDISFLLNKSFISDTAGDVYFGFSGEGQTLQWKFEKGEIRDPDNQIFASYSPLENFILSGDISDDYYNYSFNNTSIVRGKAKVDFKIENFFVNTTLPDTYLDTSLFIYSDGITHAFTLQDEVVIGANFTGQLVNNSIDGKLVIYSATLKGQALANYSIISFPSYINPSSTGSFTFGSSSATSGMHAFEMTLATNIGTILVTSSIEASSPQTVFVMNRMDEYSLNASSINFDEINGEASSSFFYYSSMFGGDPIQSVTPSLEYKEGNVGTYHRVTGVNVGIAGEGYSGEVTVSFSGDEGNDVAAEGTVVMNEAGDSVSEVTITNPGIYYGSEPSVSFGGASTVSALGTALTETYNKTFSECWDIYTGISLTGSTNSGFVTGNQGDAEYDHVNLGPGIYENPNQVDLISEQNFYIKIKAKSFYDFDPIKAKLKITGSLADSNTERTVEEVIITSQNTTA